MSHRAQDCYQWLIIALPFNIGTYYQCPLGLTSGVYLEILGLVPWNSSHNVRFHTERPVSDCKWPWHSTVEKEITLVRAGDTHSTEVRSPLFNFSFGIVCLHFLS